MRMRARSGSCARSASRTARCSMCAVLTESRSVIARQRRPRRVRVTRAVTRTLRGRLWRAITERDSVKTAHMEHRAVLEALRAHDPERARIRMAAHLLGVEEFASAHPAQTAPDLSLIHI